MTAKATSLPTEGLRARKSRETQQRIAQHAVVLFLREGYDETTIEAIARAADVSRRTFFHYFESKQAVLGAIEEELEEEFRQELFGQSSNLPFDAMEQALTATIARWYQREDAGALDRLMLSTRTRQGIYAGYEARERALAKALAERFPDLADSHGLELIALTGIAALRVAIDRSARPGQSGSVGLHFRKAMGDLRREAALGSASTSDNRYGSGT